MMIFRAAALLLRSSRTRGSLRQRMTTTTSDDPIDQLATIHGRTWQHLKKCQLAAGVERERIRSHIEKLVPANCAFLVFGSLARSR
jgi:hypothetical protein